MQYIKLQAVYKWMSTSIFTLILITSFGTLFPHLLLAMLLCLMLVAKGSVNTRVNYLYFIPLILFIISSLNTLSFSIFYDSDINQQLYRTRKFLFELIIAYAVLLFCINTKYHELLKIINNAMSACIIIGIVQILLNPQIRPSLLFVEPSSAGYFVGTFIFSVFLCKPKSRATIKLILITFIVRSKSLILSIISTFVVMRISLFKVVIVLVLLALFGQNLNSYLVNSSEQYRGFSHLISVLFKYGIDGFSSAFDIYNTYLTRLSAIFLGVDLIKEHPLGIGFGSFHELYVQRVGNFFSIESLGEEVASTIKYGLITPKSNFFEHSLSFGLLGIGIFIYWFISL
ncbi:hypothetical protein, partial [Shewanella sp.]|uniref:hypothetical protein n=1 Tax=Shewanella sp. TaxID=50422 RepID=UPI003567F20C